METRARGFHGATCASAVRARQEERTASRKKRLRERFANQFGGSVLDGNDLTRLCEFHGYFQEWSRADRAKTAGEKRIEDHRPDLIFHLGSVISSPEVILLHLDRKIDQCLERDIREDLLTLESHFFLPIFRAWLMPDCRDLREQESDPKRRKNLRFLSANRLTVDSRLIARSSGENLLFRRILFGIRRSVGWSKSIAR